MPDARLWPYRHTGDSLAVRFETISIDGLMQEHETLVDERNATLDLSATSDWTAAEISLSVEDPEDTVASAIAHGELIDNVVELFAVIRISDTRIRASWPLERCVDGAWVGKIRLERAKAAGRGTLNIVAVRSADGRPPMDTDVAFARGEEIGCSETWKIYFDARPIIPGVALDTEWVDFGADSRQVLRERSDVAWYLELGRPEAPRLLFNEGIDGLRRALSVTAHIGRSARLRDVLVQSLLQPVVQDLAVAALDTLRDSDDDPGGWRSDLLQRLAGLAGHESAESTRNRWLDAWKTDKSGVLVELSTAVQRHLGVASGAASLIRALEDHQRG